MVEMSIMDNGRVTEGIEIAYRCGRAGGASGPCETLSKLQKGKREGAEVKYLGEGGNIKERIKDGEKKKNLRAGQEGKGA